METSWGLLLPFNYLFFVHEHRSPESSYKPLESDDTQQQCKLVSLADLWIPTQTFCSDSMQQPFSLGYYL